MELSFTASNLDITVSLMRAIQGDLTLLCSELKKKTRKLKYCKKICKIYPMDRRKIYEMIEMK